MQLLEYVVQGLRHIPEQRRIVLGGGLCALVDGSEGAPKAAVLAAALRGVLTLDPSHSYASDVADPAAAASRVGLMLRGRDGATYRLIHDLKTGTVALHKSANGGAMEAVSSNTTEVFQFLRSQVGLAPEEPVRQLLAAAAADLPSRRAASEPAPGMSAPGMMPPGMMPPGAAGQVPGMPAAAAAGGKFAHLSKEEKTQRLEQVKAALKQLKQQQELEFELDGVQQKRFQLEESLRPLKGAESKLAEAMAGMNAFEDLARVPPDFPRQLEMYTRLKIALDDEFRKADEKASSARRTAEDRPVFPPWSDRLFQIGLGVAVGAVAVGVGLAQALEMPSLRYLGLLDLGGFGAMGLSLLSYIGRLEAREALKEVGAVAAERKDKAQRRFDLDTSNVRKVLAELSLKDDKDLDVFRDRLAARSAAQARLDQVKQQVTETRAQSGGANSEELQKLTSRQAEIEGKLAGMGFTGSEKDLKVEQAALSAELGLGGGDEVEGDGYQSGYPQGGGGKGGSQASADDDERWPMLAPGSGGTSGAYAMSAGSPPGGGGPPMPYMMPGSMPPMMSGPPDSIMRLMKASLDLFHVPIEKVGPMVQPRAAQYLGAFADRRFSNLTFTDRGDAVAVDAQGKVLPYATMSMLDQDLVYLSVLLTLVETYAKQHKSPVIIDNWFAGLPDLKHPLLAKMLQYLASLTQVVHFCSKPGLAEGAEPKVVL